MDRQHIAALEDFNDVHWNKCQLVMSSRYNWDLKWRELYVVWRKGDHTRNSRVAQVQTVESPKHNRQAISRKIDLYFVLRNIAGKWITWQSTALQKRYTGVWTLVGQLYYDRPPPKWSGTEMSLYRNEPALRWTSSERIRSQNALVPKRAGAQMRRAQNAPAPKWDHSKKWARAEISRGQNGPAPKYNQRRNNAAP